MAENPSGEVRALTQEELKVLDNKPSPGFQQWIKDGHSAVQPMTEHYKKIDEDARLQANGGSIEKRQDIKLSDVANLEKSFSISAPNKDSLPYLRGGKDKLNPLDLITASLEEIALLQEYARKNGPIPIQVFPNITKAAFSIPFVKIKLGGKEYTVGGYGNKMGINLNADFINALKKGANDKDQIQGEGKITQPKDVRSSDENTEMQTTEFSKKFNSGDYTEREMFDTEKGLYNHMYEVILKPENSPEEKKGISILKERIQEYLKSKNPPVYLEGRIGLQAYKSVGGVKVVEVMSEKEKKPITLIFDRNIGNKDLSRKLSKKASEYIELKDSFKISIGRFDISEKNVLDFIKIQEDSTVKLLQSYVRDNGPIPIFFLSDMTATLGGKVITLSKFSPLEEQPEVMRILQGKKQ